MAKPVLVGFNVLGWDPETGAPIYGHIARWKCAECGRGWWDTEYPPCACGEEEFYREPTPEEVEQARRERRPLLVGWNFPYRSVPLLRCPFCGQEEWDALRCECLEEEAQE